MNTPPIFTLTGNLLAERTCEFNDWAPGKTQRAHTGSFQVGGKGINVSRTLARFDHPGLALCFAGGPSGEECRTWLSTHSLPHRIFTNSSATRTGLVVRSPLHPETTFLGADVPPDARACTECAAFLDTCPPGATLAMCGSFPGWDSTPASPVRDAIARWLQRGPVVADTYGPPLLSLSRLPLALIKVNRSEFDGLFTAADQSRPVPDRIAESLHRWPAQRWIVTDGPREVCYGASDTPPSSMLPPPVKEVSATGSGDVLFACVLHAWLARGFTLAEALAFALPYAAANAAAPGIADFELNKTPLKRSVRP